MPVIGVFLRGPLDRYRAIAAGTVARAMVAGAAVGSPGRFTWEHRDIIEQAGTGA
jgi:hypothetical protein